MIGPGSPYRGLAPFGDTGLDAQFFFGRERDREIIAANLVASRLTVLYGPSGVGKSSVLRAGVAHELHALARRNLEVRGRPGLAAVVFDSWSADPVRGIADAVAAAVADLLPGVEPVPPADSLADTIRAWSDRIGGELYIVLDQAEEYFVYHGGEDGPGTLVAELPEVVNRGDVRAHVLLAVSEDAVAKLDVFKGRIPNLFGNYVRLDRLDRESARAAIVGPLAERNRLVEADEAVEIEPELVEAVLDQVAAGRIDLRGRGVADGQEEGGRIETPFLQLVMGRLWEVEQSAGSRTLRLSTLQDLGGAARIVEEHLESALAGLTPAQRDLAAAVFNHLVTPSGTKIAHGVADLAQYSGAEPAELVPVLRTLSDARILRPVADAEGEGARYEIFHDVLADAVLAWRTGHEAGRALERERLDAARRYRRLLGVAVGALVVAFAMVAVAVFALTQRSHARAEARRSHAHQLASDAVAQGATDPERALRLAAQSVRLDPASENQDVLRTELAGLRAEAVLPGGGGPVRTAAVSPDGALVLTVAPGAKPRLFDARTGVLVRALRDPSQAVSAAFAPDGDTIVTAEQDGSARLWKTADGSLVGGLGGGTAPLTGASFSPGGRLLVTTGTDGTAQIWNAETLRQLRRIRHRTPVTDASFSPDGSRLVTVARDRFARLFGVPSGRLVARLDQPGRVTSASFSPLGDLVVTTGLDGTARIWDARTGAPRARLVGHVGQVLDADFSPAGDAVVTASTDGTARVWDAKTGAMTAELVGHTNYVNSARFSRDGNFVVTSGEDGTARVWNLHRLGLTTVLIGHDDAVSDASFSPDGKTVVTASDDGTARLWNAQFAPALGLLGRHSDSVNSVAFSPDGKLVVSAGWDGTARVWKAGGGLVRRLVHGSPVLGASFGDGGRLVLTWSGDGTARLWRVADGRELATLQHGAPAGAAALSQDGRLAVTAGADDTARIWSLPGGRELHTLRAGAPLVSTSFSPDGELVLAAGADGRAWLWRTDTGAPVHTLEGHRGPLVAAAFSPDGSTVVTAGKDRTARLWDTSTGKLLHVLRRHRAPLTSASFSPDGTRVVTTSLDHDTRIWDAATGRPLRLVRDTAVVSGAAFSPDGRWVATAGPGRAGLFDAGTGRLLFNLDGQARLLTSVAFSPTGWRIVTGGDDGAVRTYDCTLCSGAGGLLALSRARLASLSRGQ